jgi:hypothetical protein
MSVRSPDVAGGAAHAMVRSIACRGAIAFRLPLEYTSAEAGRMALDQAAGSSDRMIQ